jgi:hypothetical protein
MPTHFLSARLLAPIAALVMALAPGVPAVAQPVAPAELRREIENLQVENQSLANQVRVLTDQLATLQAEHAAALERLRTVEAENQFLREQGAQAAPPGAAAPTESTEPAATHAPIPEDPLASPASMLAELQRRYNADFGPPADPNMAPSPPPIDTAAPPLTSALRKALDLWCVGQARELRGPIEWRVRFTGLRALDRSDYAAMLTVIDPATGLPIGDTLEVAVPRDQAERLARELGPTGGDVKAPLWVLTGSIIARPRFSADRATAGVFNHPAFVGPYVEFGFELDWEAVALAPPGGDPPSS